MKGAITLELETQLTSILERRAINKRSAILRTINSSLISMFWEIGASISKRLDESSADHENVLINEVADIFVPISGTVFLPKNLSLMVAFSKKCSLETMKHIAPYINWDFLPFLSKLEDNKEWLFYVDLLHAKSLNPSQLAKKISKGIVKEDTKANSKKKAKASYLALHSEKFYLQTAKLYFGEENIDNFRKLMQPDGDYRTNPVQYFEKGLLTDIGRLLIQTQIRCNFLINLEFNRLFWEIGNDIISFTNIEGDLITSDLIEDCRKKLSEHFPSIFSKEQLNDSLKFASLYREQSKTFEIIEILSWSYLRILLSIHDIALQYQIAKKVIKQGIAIDTLKTMAQNGSLENLANSGDSLLANVDSEVSVFEIVRHNKKINLQYDHNKMDINPENDISRNIFRNPDLLAFLTGNL